MTVDANGVAAYTLNDPLTLSIDLGTLANASVSTSSTTPNLILLDASSGVTINAGAGNTVFATSVTARSLGGDQIVAGAGINFIQVGGPATTIDLTASSTPGGAGSTGIAAVVGRNFFSQHIPTLDVVDIAWRA